MGCHGVTSPVSHPAPVGYVPHCDPDRPPERPGKMRDRCVAGDHQIEADHDGRGIEEGALAAVEAGAQGLDRHPVGQSGKLIDAIVLLQAD